MKKNIQAFTLMELLAVLVILAIIALIVFPIIGDVITDSKMKAFKSSVDGLEHAIELDYQKDYYKGVREYVYDNGNLTLYAVKGESKNNNIKIEGIIENGIGTLSVDKDGNTSLIVYNDEYCAIKENTDKKITVDTIDSEFCASKTGNDTCYEVEVVKSYDVNLEKCKTYIDSLDFRYNDSNLELLCTKDGVTSDGYSLDRIMEEGYCSVDELVENEVIKNVVYETECNSCFAYEQNIESYDINLEKCKTFIDSESNSSYDDENLTLFCTKGQTASDGYSIEMLIDENSYTAEELETEQVISNVVYENTVKITDYRCYEENKMGYPVISDVTIPLTLSSKKVTKIGNYAFYENGLTSVTIPNTITSIGAAAFNNNQLPDNQAFIYARKSDGSNDTSKLVSYGGANRNNVIIPNGVKIIGIDSFYGDNITKVKIANSVETIENYAFYKNALTSVTLGNSVQTIGKRTFYGNLLSNVFIPSSVQSIGYEAFRCNYDYPSTYIQLSFEDETNKPTLGGNVNMWCYPPQ